MKKSRNRDQLLDSIPVAFLLTDVHSKVVYTNQYTKLFFGYSRDEIVGQRIRILFLEEDLTYFAPNIVYLTLFKNGFSGECLLRQKDGTRIFVYLSTSSFKEGREIYLTFSFQEIQRLKKLERERIEMNHWANLGMMVEEIAHQVRNPIVSIGGIAQRLQKVFSPLPKSKVYLDRILRDTKKLETMIQQVEEYILIHRPILQREKIQEVVERALQPFYKDAVEKGICLNLDASALEGDGSLFIDKELVIKALSCILKNSFETLAGLSAKTNRKTVEVILFKDRQRVGISVSDRGEGISKNNLNYIFNPFFTTRPGRVGLGLTFTKKVVEEHQGEIQVESRVNRETTVTITFPKDRRREMRRELISFGADISSLSPS